MRFDRIVIAGLAVAASLGFTIRDAAAVDMPVYELPELTSPSGLYVGAFLGWGQGDSEVAAVDPESDGFIGGALAGWELRRGNFLVGIEGDFAAANIEGVNSAASTSVDVNWLASLRLRSGFVTDGYSIYGTGGVAFANMEATISTSAPPSDTATLTGFALGGGIGLPLTENLSARLEYMYYDFNASDYIIGGVAVQGDLQLHTVRAALVYNFNLL